MRAKRFLEDERKRDGCLDNLLNYLMGRTRTYLFGGVLRDLALCGVDGLEADIDLVYEGKVDSESLIRHGIRTKANRFDGYRTRTDRWLVDFWSVEDTWAFRNHVVEYRSIESLLETTITNWESVLYDITQERIMFKDGYLKDINDLYLDTVLEENPNSIGLYVRLIRTYLHKDACFLSARAASAIRNAVCEYSFEYLSAYEARHYRSSYITRSDYDYIRLNKELSKQDLLPVTLDKVNRSPMLI